MSKQGEVFTGGACTSQHVDAEDDDHFHNTTFKLKRTRSLGLLDEFIDTDTQEKQIEKKNEEKRHEKVENSLLATTSTHNENSITIELNLNVDRTSGSSDVTGSSPLDPNTPFLKSPDIVPHDDSNLAPEPSRHVDYLSHQWDVSDISKSWRYIILRRKNVTNAARLENASWRTWAQRRCNLKTISPEEVNWSKESDVTWLYGPIVDDDDHDHEHYNDDCNASSGRSFNTASNVVAGDISIARKAHRPKPILKKRTMQDMMISHLNLLKLEVATARAELEHRRREDAAAQARRDAAASSERPPEYFDYDVISAKLNSQYKNYSQNNSRAGLTNNSCLNLAQRNNEAASADAVAAALEKVGPSKPAAITPDILQELADEQMAAPVKRSVHFNDEVQQCIAIDDDSDYEDGYGGYDDYDSGDYDYDGTESYIYESGSGHPDRDHYEGGLEDDENEDEDEDDDDEGGFFLNVRSSATSITDNTFPSLSLLKKAAESLIEEEDDDDTASVLSVRTVRMLPPTTINYGSSNEESDDYTSSISHNIDNSSSRGYDYYYDYNSVYEVNPNHAIYGSNSRSSAPDVVDVPENISLGSNFDYEIIENEDVSNYGSALQEVYGQDETRKEDTARSSERIPISSLDDSASGKLNLSSPTTFNCDAFHSESDSDSENEVGLSISARNSSQSLAQQVFGQPLSEITAKPHHFPELFVEVQEPQPQHILAINPRYSSTSLSKQPHSSGSLADQFFGGTTTLSKSNSDLVDMFLNSQDNSSNTGTNTGTVSYETQTNSRGATSNLSANISGQSYATLGPTAALGTYGSTNSPPVQRKVSPLPPTTTAANIFSGSRTPTPKGQQPKSLFVFDSGDDSEPEFVEDNSFDSGTTDKNASSFASLYKVAGRTGISRPTGEEDQKKGLAVSHFLGGWKKGNNGN